MSETCPSSVPGPPSPHQADGGSPIKPQRGRLARLVAATVAAGLFAAVMVAVGAEEVAALWARADWGLLALALALTQVQVLLSAWRWRFTAARLGYNLPFARALRETALGWLVNMTMPGGVAGDVLRAVRSVQGGAGPRAAIRSVMLDRIAGQVAFWAVAGVGLVLWLFARGDAPGGAVAAVAAVPAAAGLAVAGVAVAGRHGPPALRGALGGLWPDVRRAFVDDGALLPQAAASLALAAGYVLLFALAGAAIGAPLPPLAVATLIPLALLAMLVPIGFGGWGLREGAAAMLWPLAGLGAAEGAATAALYGLLVLVGGLPGLIALRAPRPAPMPPTSGASTA